MKKKGTMPDKMIKVIFGIRVLLWMIAAAATAYWIVWSFKLYNRGIFDYQEYAANLRPRMGWGLLISFVCIIVCFVLRRISDNIKKKSR